MLRNHFHSIEITGVVKLSGRHRQAELNVRVYTDGQTAASSKPPTTFQQGPNNNNSEQLTKKNLNTKHCECCKIYKDVKKRQSIKYINGILPKKIFIDKEQPKTK